MSNITINLSLSDLEKILLDKDGEIKVQFSEQVADGFAKKYLKSIIHDKVFEQLTKTCKTAVEKEITEAYINFRTQDYLTERLRRLIDSYAEKAVQNALSISAEFFGIPRFWIPYPKHLFPILIDDEKTIIYDYAKKYFDNGIHKFINSIADQQFNIIQQNFWNAVKNTNVKDK